MSVKTIFTLNARDNVFLDVMKDYLNLNEDQIYSEIEYLFDELGLILESKNINYQDLKKGLIPSLDRKEVAFVFDTNRIKSGSYGADVFEHLLPAFSNTGSHSVLCGDYIGDDELKETLYEEFRNRLLTNCEIDYRHHSQFYIVYINNLSEKMLESFSEKLDDYAGYVGYFDLTVTSFLKSYLSTILVNSFLISKNQVISAHEDDRDNKEDLNMYGYSFEENGFNVRSIQSMYFMLFLSYKIERGVIAGFESDTSFSLNAIGSDVMDIYDFELQVEEKKLGYLKSEKGGSLKKADLSEVTVQELEELIKLKLKDNYIYNLTFIKEHNTLKFNIMLDVTARDGIIRLNAALEYLPSEKVLRLITMFG